jgi:hypothetical protein
MAVRHELTFSARADSIDKEAGILNGVSMVTIGPVRGHGVYADEKTLESVRACAETYEGGLKVKMEHGTGAKDIVGVLNGYRIKSPNLRADFHMLKASPHFAHLLEMAETMPGAFGLSISFSGDYETIEIAEGLKVEAMRCREIYSCDVVDSPAANPNGLFMTKQKEGADVPAGDKKDAGTPTEAPAIGAPEKWAEFQAKLEAVIVRANAAVATLETMQKQLLEQFESLATKFADAELLALRRLGAMGIPASAVPATATGGTSSGTAAAVVPGKTLSEQLEAIPAKEIERRRRFMAEHRLELFDELASKRGTFVEVK